MLSPHVFCIKTDRHTEYVSCIHILTYFRLNVNNLKQIIIEFIKRSLLCDTREFAIYVRIMT